MNEQPAGAWIARSYAARIWQLLERIKGEFPKDLDADDLELIEEIGLIKEKIRAEKQTPEGKARTAQLRIEEQVKERRKRDRKKAR